MLNLSIEKHTVDIIQATVTCLALIAGGVWTFWLTSQKRHIYPRARISHTIHQKQLSRKLILIRVEVNLENVGEVLVRFEHVRIWISQVRPVPLSIARKAVRGDPLYDDQSSEVEWPLAPGTKAIIRDWRAEVEPGEKETFLFDFILTKPITTIQIYSYVENSAKKKPSLSQEMVSYYEDNKAPEPISIGWGTTTLYDLKGESDGHKTSTTENTTENTTEAAGRCDGTGSTQNATTGIAST